MHAFGRDKGRRLFDLPVPYVVWFARQDFPARKFGHMLRTVHEIGVDGLEFLFGPLR